MTQATTKPLTFKEFLESRPEDGRFELVDGEIVRILATRQHDNVAEFISDQLKAEKNRLQIPFRVSGRIVVRTQTADGRIQGRHPDVSVVDQVLWDSNPLAYSALTEPLQLAVEVVSTNWEDDYIDKLDEYQRLGIKEYWIVDYLAIGPRSYLGNPKVPTIFVHQLIDGRYQAQAFTGSSRIISPTFSELQLTIEQILEQA
ncbi:MAG: Uma2 family endonuclease [Chroococcidiopsidaceae cyanobacterium CP_BM_ER_R8_30]|nr:Uma2 family endonuclease [Chroococcidiopsidaceae cyanobacterium CP_BM_ER_R8_30]